MVWLGLRIDLGADLFQLTLSLAIVVFAPLLLLCKLVAHTFFFFFVDVASLLQSHPEVLYPAAASFQKLVYTWCFSSGPELERQGGASAS